MRVVQKNNFVGEDRRRSRTQRLQTLICRLDATFANRSGSPTCDRESLSARNGHRSETTPKKKRKSLCIVLGASGIGMRIRIKVGHVRSVGGRCGGTISGFRFRVQAFAFGRLTCQTMRTLWTRATSFSVGRRTLKGTCRTRASPRDKTCPDTQCRA